MGRPLRPSALSCMSREGTRSALSTSTAVRMAIECIPLRNHKVADESVLHRCHAWSSPTRRTRRRSTKWPASDAFSLRFLPAAKNNQCLGTCVADLQKCIKDAPFRPLSPSELLSPTTITPPSSSLSLVHHPTSLAQQRARRRLFAGRQVPNWELVVSIRSSKLSSTPTDTLLNSTRG